MSRRQYADEDIDEAADRRYDEAVQNEIDDNAEHIAALRVASGISKEELSLQDARIAGAKAGHAGWGASMNPYQAGCQEHAEWDRERMRAIGTKLNNPFANRRVA